MSSEKSMMLITSSWNEKPSFRMIPVETSCPYNEVIYDTELKALAIVSKEKKDTFQFLPKLDQNGDLVPLRKPGANGRRFAEERKLVETYYEYFVTDAAEVEAFIQRFALNAEKFDYKALLVVVE
jgi:hypothetical protein